MRTTLYLISLFFSFVVSGQKTIPAVLKKLNKESVPYIYVTELKEKKNLVFIDAREQKEFDVSHISGAIPAGYNQFKPKTVTQNIKDKETTIVVYCSIGVRSERIGEKLLKLGYKNVFNLYGGIFEYKNTGGTVVDNKNQATDSVHAYNKTWSSYLKKGIKVY